MIGIKSCDGCWFSFENVWGICYSIKNVDDVLWIIGNGKLEWVMYLSCYF